MAKLEAVLEAQEAQARASLLVKHTIVSGIWASRSHSGAGFLAGMASLQANPGHGHQLLWLSRNMHTSGWHPISQKNPRPLPGVVPQASHSLFQFFLGMPTASSQRQAGQFPRTQCYLPKDKQTS